MATRLLCYVSGALRTLRTSHPTTLFGSLPRIVKTPLRSVKQKTGKLPFEGEENVKLRVRVFSCKEDRKFKYVTLFGFVQFAFWFHLGALNLAEKRPERYEDDYENKVQVHGFWLKLTDVVDKSKDKIAVATMLLGKFISHIHICIWLFWLKYDLEVLHTPSSTRLEFKPMSSRSWTVHSYPWDTDLSHWAIKNSFVK